MKIKHFAGVVAAALLALGTPAVAQETTPMKEFTLEDLNFGGTNYRNMIPQSRRLTWWGDQLVRLETKECYLVDKKTGKETVLFTVDDVNEWMGGTPDNGLRSLSGARFLYADQPLVLLNYGGERCLIDFEQSMMANINNKQRVIDLSQGIEPLKGCCSHGHKHHTHGIDPHIWCAPRTLTTMVKNMHAALKERYTDSTKYDIAAEAILSRLSNLDKECAENIESSGVQSIMIYHPAYTYLARDYGIEQIAIEQEGKEPTPKQLRTLIDKARSQNIDIIFHQPQYNANKLSAIATESGAEIVVTDPLADDIVAEIERLIKLVCNE